MATLSPLDPRAPARRLLAVLATVVLALAGVLALVTVAPAAAGGSPCGSSINPIVCENSQAGTPQSVWDVGGVGDPSIQGFATDISVNAGNPISFKINTSAPSYTIDVYRLGYYQGNGARKVASVTPVGPQNQPACASAPTGLYDCGTWAVSATWAVPSSAVSGVYVADLTRPDTGGMSQIDFVVRNDASTSDIVYQTSDETWEAYNRYGGGDFYTGNEQALYDSPNRASQISYNRPFLTRGDSGGQDFLFSNEYPTIRYLEQNGYDVSYIAGVDTDRYGATLLNQHKVFMSVGHDEYWSLPQRTNVQTALGKGLNLMFLSGNEMFWHTRFAPSIDGTSTPYRTLICYKETWRPRVVDPSGESTGTFRDPRYSAAPGGSSPENGLTGTLYEANSDDLPLQVTGDQAKDRLWRNSGLSTASGALSTVAQHVIGYESDEDLDNGFRNAGQVDLSSTVGSSPQELNDFGQGTSPGTTTHHITLYRAPSGALVFGAGTIQWGWGLDADHDGTKTTASPVMRQMMINLFADMGVQPSTIDPSLVTATASTDRTAPTSTITSPAAGASIGNGMNLTVSGTATDVGGVVAGVEVSIDGGSTWHPAAGTASWTYTGIVHGDGPVTILSRATDDSMNTEVPGAGVTITTSCPCSVFGQAVPKTPDNGDSYRAEVGMRFTPDTTGYVTGVRYYKAAANTGTHIGSLWTSNGTQLATGTFTGETATGWQTLVFPSAVPVSAGTTYVVGYWAPNGHYAEDDYSFYYHDVDASPLHAVSNSPTDTSKYNGAFASSNTFPSTASDGANYYVDPLFSPGVNGLPVVTGRTPADGSQGTSTTVAPTATFSTAVDPSTIVFTLNGPGGAATGATSYDAASRTATFTPASPLASGTTYTASITASGTDGTAMPSPSTWSFGTVGTISCPCTLFPSSATPGTVDSGDGAALSVGMQFSSAVAGYVTGVRFYKASANTGAHTGSLWAADGTLLATGSYGSESASGWQTLTFATAVAISANTTYTVSTYDPSGHYSEDDHYFDIAKTNGPLTAPAAAGVYVYGGDRFPSSTYANANYWIDPVFTTGNNTTPPTVTSFAPAASATAVPLTTSVSATFSAPVTQSSIAFTVTGPSGSAVPGGPVAYDATAQQATFTPSSSLAASTTYSVSVTATGTNGVATSSPTTWSFTTAAPATPPTVTSVTPAASAVNVAVTTTVTAAFSAPVTAGSIAFTVTGPSGSTVSGGPIAYDATAQQATFTPSSSLAAGTTYTASVSATGTNGAAMTSPTTWSFTTAAPAPPPPTPPTVTSFAPAASATNVSTLTAPYATFSASVTSGSIAFTLSSSAGPVSGAVAYVDSTKRATFTPSAALAPNTAYTASVSATGTNGGAMPTPTTWTFTTGAAADKTPPKATAIAASGSGTTATVTWTTDELSTSRVNYGLTSSSLTKTATTAGSVTAHTVALAGLSANVRYYYQVVSVDAAGNSASAPSTPATYIPTIAPFTDTSWSDFRRGTSSNTYGAMNGDGELVLSPKFVAEFATATLPGTVRSTPLVSGGSSTPTGTAAQVSGAQLRTTAVYSYGKSYETMANLGPNQRIGWTSSSNSSVQMAFSLNSSGQVVATVFDGLSNNAGQVVAPRIDNSLHDFRIDWTSTAATFYLDGVQVYTHAFHPFYGTTYFPYVSDALTSDLPMSVDWMRIAPYAASGTYVSRVFDAASPVNWGTLGWDATVPAGTGLTVSVRTGPTATPGSGWTAWRTISASGATVGGNSRYLQYSLALTSSTSLFTTPAVRSVSVNASA